MISTKGRYALRVMLELARRNTTEYVPLKEIAEKEQISKKYLDRICQTHIIMNRCPQKEGNKETEP